MNSKTVRGMVVELFAASNNKIKSEITDTWAGGIPFLDAHVMTSGKIKRAGASSSTLPHRRSRAKRWIDAQVSPRQHLIGLRHLAPTPELYAATQYSELVYSWVVAVLSDFDISLDNDVFAIVSDGGSDVKCCASNPSFLNKPLEWCGAHMLNRAIAKALEYGADEGAGVQGEEEKRDDDAPAGGGAIRSGRDLLHFIRKIVVSIYLSPLRALSSA
ncbi:Hypothetical protein NocV09_00301810 [Nannochloropsis oceanica]